MQSAATGAPEGDDDGPRHTRSGSWRDTFDSSAGEHKETVAPCIDDEDVVRFISRKGQIGRPLELEGFVEKSVTALGIGCRADEVEIRSVDDPIGCLFRPHSQDAEDHVIGILGGL